MTGTGNRGAAFMSSTTEPLVETRGLTVTYGSRTVLEDIDLTVGAGEIVTLIGPNGAGKTTLVKSVLGLVKPSAGSIRRRAGLTIGYMPQRLQVERTLPLTVRRFLTLWQRVDRADLARVLDEVGASHVIDGAVQTLSGGELQRVLLARALAQGAPLLVADEPCAALDPAQSIRTAKLLRARAEAGGAVLATMHDLPLAARYCTRLVVLDCGKVRADGPPEAVLTPALCRDVFGISVIREGSRWAIAELEEENEEYP